MEWNGVRTLGRSGLQVSAVGLGCWAIGGEMGRDGQALGYANADDDAARAAVRRGVEAGVTLFDTADVYGAGHSEQLLGEVLGDRPEILVATKFGNTLDEQSRQLTGSDVTPGYVRSAVRASLRRLRRERIDLYQLHHSDVTAGQAEDLVAVLEDLAAEGLIAWWGVSVDDPEVAGWFAGAPHCTAMQLQLNVIDGNPGMLGLCAANDLAALCRSPLAMGLLGGRYGSTSRIPADDVRAQNLPWLNWFVDGRPSPAYLAAIEAVREALTSDGRSLAQGALGWILAHDERTVPLPGFRSSAQVQDNTGVIESGPLTPEAYAAVEKALARQGSAGAH